MDVVGFLETEIPAFLLALQFLTRLRLTAPYSPEAMRASPRWYPGVGAVVGGIAALAYVLGYWLFTPLLAVLMAVAAGMAVTGALHEDGFADACDGLGGQRPKERVLEIMRDSRIGTYGVLGLILMVAVKVATLYAIPGMALPFVLIAGHAASRAAMLWVMATSDYVRERGAGSSVAGGIDRQAVSVALITTGVTLVPLLFVVPWSAIFTALVGLCIGLWLMRRSFEPRLGGYTGDCLGAVQQCSEAGFYLGLLLAL
ncbi:adenosylcobinamide-GDP ribazoletransferase [bacterium]|nr:adenosylcobinamide-GDP ribazoletransferase [bacterium]